MADNVVARGWFGEWALITKQWCVGAFVAATLDWMASKVPVHNGIFATLLSTAQLTTAYFLANAFRGFITNGSNVRSVTNFNDNWVLFFAIWQMSPKAVSRLSGSYRKLHIILYGQGTLPSMPSTTALVNGAGECKSGSCNK